MNPRPPTLKAVALQADSFEAFGRHFQDWLHELRRFSARSQVLTAIAEAPPRLAQRFAQGVIADAWLGAYAELLARKIGRPAPAWTARRASPEPWFAVAGDDLRSRLSALRDSPPPFKSRNLYTPVVDLPLKLSAGRPAKSAEELRQANAARQRRFRARRRAELQLLRGAAARA